jgi:hypothetical protein
MWIITSKCTFPGHFVNFASCHGLGCISVFGIGLFGASRPS